MDEFFVEWARAVEQLLALCLGAALLSLGVGLLRVYLRGRKR